MLLVVVVSAPCVCVCVLMFFQINWMELQSDFLVFRVISVLSYGSLAQFCLLFILYIRMKTEMIEENWMGKCANFGRKIAKIFFVFCDIFLFSQVLEGTIVVVRMRDGARIICWLP